MSESWFGWLRRDRRHKWQRVCGPYPTLAECSRQLGVEARKLGIAGKHTCMTQGSYPRGVQAAAVATLPLAHEERSTAETSRSHGSYLGGM